MDNFLLICTVCVDFFAPNGKVFRITPHERGIIVTAPNWIKDTLTFKLLERDGSVQFVTRENERKLENDPMDGINAEGKAKKAEKPVEPVAVDVEVEKPKRRPRKKDDVL